MKQLSFSLFLLILSILFTAVNFAMADDFYYNGSPAYNPYNGYTVMSLPPPPPMSSVPFYVRDDYDDYIEDYYKCILGYEYKGFTCRYWRNYAEKNGFYQKTAPVQNSNDMYNNANTNNINNVNNNTSSVNNQQLQQEETVHKMPEPYTPKH